MLALVLRDQAGALGRQRHHLGERDTEHARLRRHVAQRLEEAAKTIGNPDAEVNILVSAAVRSALVTRRRFERMGAHKLRGREELVEVYSLPVEPDQDASGSVVALRGLDTPRPSQN